MQLNILGNRIKQRRKELRMSGAMLAEKLGVIRNTISRWERGENKPSKNTLSCIASALETSCSFLLGEDLNYEENQTAPIFERIIQVPVYKIQEITSYKYNIKAPTTNNVDEKILLPENIFHIINEKRPPLAVVMPNDSMKGANMNEQDRIIVNPAEHVNNGDPALVIYSGTPMLRWVCYKPNGDIELQAANPNHCTIIVEARYTKNQNIITVVGRPILAIAQKDLKSAF